MIGRVAGQFKRKVGFNSNAEMTRPLVEQRPGTIVRLDRQQVLADTLVLLLIHQAHEVIEEDVLGVHGGVRLEGIVPVALRLLLTTEILLGPEDRAIQAAEKFAIPSSYFGREPLLL